ncbi:MAG: AMIN domain-containing protein [Candidatus Nitrohelix vancouverensis]|uniref:N-acetylmuramoyl-L-alanine amidase n=1 Tax=Candidatus Nitrohelix vancouverensis TaxID=2705534 RepID=A0A7T0C2S9_9BACT|nr:MAG: AMIN domain-containing protein [Candidatus Nitrohelix vancouverensis]
MRSRIFKNTFAFKIIICLLAFAILQGHSLALAADPSDSLYNQARNAFYQLKRSPEKMALRDQWVNCIDRFLKVYEKYPKSYSAYKAVFTAGQLYEDLYSRSRRQSDLDQALAYYGKVVLAFEHDRLKDDALYHRGNIYVQKKQYALAAREFERIVQEFPKGDQRANAAKQLKTVSAYLPVAQPKPLALPASSSSMHLIKDIDYVTQGNYSRIIVKMDGPTRYVQKRLENPTRVYLDIEKARIAPGLEKPVNYTGPYLKTIRWSQFDSDTARLVLELNPESQAQARSIIKDNRLIIQLEPEDQPIRVAEALVKPAPKPSSRSKEKLIPPPKQVAEKPLAQPAAVKTVPLVVLDPGHGGKDLGAVGRHGLVEKEINLKISKMVKHLLETEYKLRVHLTRDDDTFIPLKERGPIANRMKADLFVSIHANAAKRRAAHGIETYYLGRGLSEQAKETAARENGDLVYSIPDDQTQQILADLISNNKMNDSSRLAGRVQKYLYKNARKKYKTVKDLGVKEGPFWVLHDTNMASILVEVGFVTHSREASRLRDPIYLKLLAGAVAKGISDFLKEKGPTI